MREQTGERKDHLISEIEALVGKRVTGVSEAGSLIFEGYKFLHGIPTEGQATKIEDLNGKTLKEFTNHDTFANLLFDDGTTLSIDKS